MQAGLNLSSEISRLSPQTLVPLERETGSAVASYAFTAATAFDGTYRTLKLIGWLQPATDDVVLYLRISDDGGSTYEADAADYRYAVQGIGDGANAYTTTSASATQIHVCTADAGDAVGNAANERIQFEITLNNPDSTAFAKLFDIKSGYISSLGEVVTNHGTGMSVATAAVNGLQLLFESGNIALGDVTLYGVANA